MPIRARAEEKLLKRIQAVEQMVVRARVMFQIWAVVVFLGALGVLIHLGWHLFHR
jgi:type VI protein secretion system component VasF